MNLIKKISSSDLLVSEFLDKARELNANVGLIKVLKSRTYQISKSNVLIRAASETPRRYFFGINYITVEEMSNLNNPFIAFICGALNRTLIIPAKILFKNLPYISHDRNGEYKINIDKELNIVLAGKNNRMDCASYINNWGLLLSPPTTSEESNNTVEESLHSVLQGRIIEIGNIRGYDTYCPDKSKTFNDKKLSDLISLETCPHLQFSDYNLLRQIDVLWFKNRGNNLIPEYAFEIELSTGVWPGFVRMGTLVDYKNVSLFVISNDRKKYYQAIKSFYEYQDRYRYIHSELVSELYSAEINLKKLRVDIGL